MSIIDQKHTRFVQRRSINFTTPTINVSSVPIINTGIKNIVKLLLNNGTLKLTFPDSVKTWENPLTDTNMKMTLKTMATIISAIGSDKGISFSVVNGGKSVTFQSSFFLLFKAPVRSAITNPTVVHTSVCITPDTPLWIPDWNITWRMRLTWLLFCCSVSKTPVTAPTITVIIPTIGTNSFSKRMYSSYTCGEMR